SKHGGIADRVVSFILDWQKFNQVQVSLYQAYSYFFLFLSESPVNLLPTLPINKRGLSEQYCLVVDLIQKPYQICLEIL
ncbi:hypothetical protein, partial [Hyella patelloides]|uniref:hypothetical protein n=1 Tax=Hyella patelloides TaxID=1982969 RepID=UPI001C953AA4